MSLAAARDAAEDARRIRKAGGDPGAEKKAAKAMAAKEAGDTFRHYAEKARDAALAKCDPKTAPKWRLHMGYAIDHFGDWPIRSIKRGHVVEYLQGWEAVGKLDTMHSIKRKMAAAFEVALEFDAIDGNPASGIKAGRLEPVRRTSHPAIVEPVRFGQLLRSIDGYQGQPATRGCLQIAALCFARPGEIRQGRWSEIDWENATWNIPAARMKTVAGKRYDHMIPLSRQALEILRQMQAIYGRGELIFPALGKKDRPISDNTMNAALRNLGYAGDEHTAHGFRASATTIGVENLNWPRWIKLPDKIIDRQLAHIEPDETKRAYDRAKFLDARIWLMQAWADYLDTLRKGADVVSIRKA